MSVKGKSKKRRALARKYIEVKLLRRLRIFALIIAIIVGIVLFKIFLGEISIGLIVLGLIAGTIIGLIAGRMFKVTWHQETQKVISRLDAIGIIFLVLYIALEIGRKWIFGYWLQGSELTAFGLIFLAGLLLGRFLIMVKNIRKILMDKNLIPPKKAR